MFTTGRIIFTSVFIIGFAIALFYAYARDQKHQKVYYKDIWKVALTIIGVIIIFAILTFWLHE